MEQTPVVGCKISRKENSPIFFYFFAPPLPVSPGLPEADSTMDRNIETGAPEKKNRVD